MNISISANGQIKLSLCMIKIELIGTQTKTKPFGQTNITINPSLKINQPIYRIDGDKGLEMDEDLRGNIWLEEIKFNNNQVIYTENYISISTRKLIEMHDNGQINLNY